MKTCPVWVHTFTRNVSFEKRPKGEASHTMRRTSQLVATMVAAAGVLCGVFAVTLILSRCRFLPLPCVWRLRMLPRHGIRSISRSCGWFDARVAWDLPGPWRARDLPRPTPPGSHCACAPAAPNGVTPCSTALHLPLTTDLAGRAALLRSSRSGCQRAAAAMLLRLAVFRGM